MLACKFSEVLPGGLTLAYHSEVIDYSLLGFTVFALCAPDSSLDDAISGPERGTQKSMISQLRHVFRKINLYIAVLPTFQGIR
jgi:hypothetical protein